MSEYIYLNFDNIILDIISKTNAINFISNVKLDRVCDLFVEVTINTITAKQQDSQDTIIFSYF